MALMARLRGRAGLGPSTDRTAREVLVSSISLIVGKVAVMGFGFLAWVVAARLYPVAEFGLASGAVAAVTLCAQLALLGIGSAIITLLPVHEHRSSRLLDVAITVLVLTSLAAGLGFLLFAGTVLAGAAGRRHPAHLRDPLPDPGGVRHARRALRPGVDGPPPRDAGHGPRRARGHGHPRRGRRHRLHRHGNDVPGHLRGLGCRRSRDRLRWRLDDASSRATLSLPPRGGRRARDARSPGSACRTGR